MQEKPTQTASQVLRQPISSFQQFLFFCLRVIKRFFKHNGLILASSIAYNTLLSIIPLFAILMLSLSQFFEKKWLLQIIEDSLTHWLPSQAQLLTQQASQMLNFPNLFNGISLIVLLFFSSMAFSVTKSAMREIFNDKKGEVKHSLWLDLALPYLFILLIALLLVLLSFSKILIEQMSMKTLTWIGLESSRQGMSSFLFYFLGFVGTSLLLTLLYIVMPGGKISFKYASLGGLSAAFLWEVSRQILVWYFANISLVNVVYGSLGTVIVVLLSFEIAATIFLLGAAVIAELQKDNRTNFHALPTLD